ncbi:SDR family NAD(P)-dependent oxidoreductase [Rhodococcus sp. IEGM 1366]|uniref:SDR family NAD(P)-dependent oxidoreductase n=1 Tax=Rhodococcus sp. IEGM 1366 TaxID=3082223 RepID=UPI002954F701|nr:SDR family NAD(P)-dependent oxidoreductase [Rhodococcus sp. IEGM 1366]MDV8070605.1 SDR family NAD(P)-dependent oxidoreductase [Rhodococcus sp. IEGM 1366]
MLTFDGKVAVVTGGASGIGFAMAERFAKDGAKIVLADIEEGALAMAVAAIRASGADAIGVQTDVSNPESVRHLALRTLDEFDAVHILCNNAGVESGALFSDIPLRTWQWVMDVNFYGVLHGCREFLPLLRQQPEAHIVNTCSVAAFATGAPTMSPYAASKFAVLGLSENLEIELRTAGESVGVSVLCPGPVKTRMTESERNRPVDVETSTDPLRRSVLDRLADTTAESGLDPQNVADLVLDAIRTRRFFILPHPDIAINGVERRIEWMRNGTPTDAREAGK